MCLSPLSTAPSPESNGHEDSNGVRFFYQLKILSQGITKFSYLSDFEKYQEGKDGWKRSGCFQNISAISCFFRRLCSEKDAHGLPSKSPLHVLWLIWSDCTPWPCRYPHAPSQDESENSWITGCQSWKVLLPERGEHRHFKTTQVRSPIGQDLGWSPCSWDSPLVL